MAFPLPTVRVKHPLDPEVCMIINVSDLTDEHQRWDEVSKTAEDESRMRVARGPRGRWYVKLGKENVEGPFGTEEEAQAAVGAA